MLKAVGEAYDNRTLDVSGNGPNALYRDKTPQELKFKCMLIKLEQSKLYLHYIRGVSMKYPYYFEYVGRRLIPRLPKEISIFANFIQLIATDDLANEVIEAIDSVQKGDKDEEEIMINAPSVLIRPEITSVTLSEVLDNPPPDQYIETDQFRELILIWKEKIPVRFIDKDTTH